ncbi:hypothetical protein HRbin06_01041 [archaeon HR06]|nr:hypothetical protein HRbin06_01041 [archaeon HR06]
MALKNKKAYFEKIFEVKKFFINNRYNFKENDILLIQIIKSDEPKKERIRGILIFRELLEDKEDESIKIYKRKWKYVIIPNKLIRLPEEEWFNLEDIIEEAKIYYGRAEAVRIKEKHEPLIRSKIAKYI